MTDLAWCLCFLLGNLQSIFLHQRQKNLGMKALDVATSLTCSCSVNCVAIVVSNGVLSSVSEEQPIVLATPGLLVDPHGPTIQLDATQSQYW